MMATPKYRITSGFGVTVRLEKAKRSLPGDVFLRNILR